MRPINQNEKAHLNVPLNIYKLPKPSRPNAPFHSSLLATTRSPRLPSGIKPRASPHALLLPSSWPYSCSSRDRSRTTAPRLHSAAAPAPSLPPRACKLRPIELRKGADRQPLTWRWTTTHPSRGARGSLMPPLVDSRQPAAGHWLAHLWKQRQTWSQHLWRISPFFCDFFTACVILG
jgi:hypothetical protein